MRHEGILSNVRPIINGYVSTNSRSAQRLARGASQADGAGPAVLRCAPDSSNRGAHEEDTPRSVWTAVGHPACSSPVAPRTAGAPPRDTSPQVLDVQGGKIRVVTVATGLFHPWGIAFADANTILVTEKNGALRMIRDGVLAPQPVWTSPTPRRARQRRPALRCRASEVRRQPARIRLVSEAGREGHDARRRARAPEGIVAR